MILYTKSHFGAIFGPTCMYKKLRNFRTVPPGGTNLVSKCAGNLKEKSHKVARRELCALQSNRAKCRGGPFRPPPPSLFRVKATALCAIAVADPEGGAAGAPPLYNWINRVFFCLILYQDCIKIRLKKHERSSVKTPLSPASYDVSERT